MSQCWKWRASEGLVGHAVHLLRQAAADRAVPMLAHMANPVCGVSQQLSETGRHTQSL